MPNVMILMNSAQTIAYSNQEKIKVLHIGMYVAAILGDLYFIQLQTLSVIGRVIDIFCASNSCSTYHIIFLYFSSQQGQKVLMFYYTELYLFGSQSQVRRSCVPIHSNCNDKKKNKSLPSAKGEQSKALNRKIHLPSVLTSSVSVALLWNCKWCKINNNLSKKSSGLNHSNDCHCPLKKSKVLLTVTVQMLSHWGLKYID